MEARSAKQLSLVVYGIEESEVSADSDLQSVLAVCNDTMDCAIDPSSLENVYRLGRQRSPNDRPRPVKVHVRNTAVRENILSAAKRKLRLLPASHKHKKVFIRPDWTSMQRQQDYLRRQARRSTQAASSSLTYAAATASFTPNARGARDERHGGAQQAEIRSQSTKLPQMQRQPTANNDTSSPVTSSGNE